jgi:hypothetical protein
MKNKIFSILFSVLLFASITNAQTAEVTISLNEQFFDALLDSIFKNLKHPEFPLAKTEPKPAAGDAKSFAFGFAPTGATIENPTTEIRNPRCEEKLVLQREINGVRTAVRFRDGQIFAPIAFSGSYNPPLVGCINFQGHADATVELEFDQQRQALIGRIKVSNVQLGSVANVAGAFIARQVQSSIDKRVNPIEILRADKLSFVVPVQNSGGSLNLKATGLRHEIGNGVLNVHISFEFLKAE